MQNLTEQQYELALQYMQQTGEDSFQKACQILSKYNFNLQNAINPPLQENSDDLCEQQQMVKMKRYFLKKVDKIKTKNNISKKLQSLKRITGQLCLNLTQKIMPQIIKRKIIRSQFHCIYQPDSSIEILYRSFQEAIFNAKQSKKYILAIISNKSKNNCIAQFLRKKKLLKFIEQNFIICGTIESQLHQTQLQGQRAPQVLFMRENRYQQFEIIDNFYNQEEILSIKEEKVREVMQKAQQKLEKQKRFMQKTANRLLQPFDIEQTFANVNRQNNEQQSQVEEEAPVKYIENIRKSKMIRQQNKEYQLMQKQIKKKQQDRQAKQKLDQQIKQQRQLRRFSLPQQPFQGDIIKILFRCPNGDSIVRNFERSQRLQLLYNWVQLSEDIQFQEKRQFDLFYSYPPESLSDKKQQLLSIIFEEKQEKIMIKQI